MFESRKRRTRQLFPDLPGDQEISNTEKPNVPHPFATDIFGLTKNPSNEPELISPNAAKPKMEDLFGAPKQNQDFTDLFKPQSNAPKFEDLFGAQSQAIDFDDLLKAPQEAPSLFQSSDPPIEIMKVETTFEPNTNAMGNFEMPAFGDNAVDLEKMFQKPMEFDMGDIFNKAPDVAGLEDIFGVKKSGNLEMLLQPKSKRENIFAKEPPITSIANMNQERIQDYQDELSVLESIEKSSEESIEEPETKPSNDLFQRSADKIANELEDNSKNAILNEIVDEKTTEIENQETSEKKNEAGDQLVNQAVNEMVNEPKNDKKDESENEMENESMSIDQPKIEISNESKKESCDDLANAFVDEPINKIQKVVLDDPVLEKTKESGAEDLDEQIDEMMKKPINLVLKKPTDDLMNNLPDDPINQIANEAITKALNPPAKEYKAQTENEKIETFDDLRNKAKLIQNTEKAEEIDSKVKSASLTDSVNILDNSSSFSISEKKPQTNEELPSSAENKIADNPEDFFLKKGKTDDLPDLFSLPVYREAHKADNHFSEVVIGQSGAFKTFIPYQVSELIHNLEKNAEEKRRNQPSKLVKDPVIVKREPNRMPIDFTNKPPFEPVVFTHEKTVKGVTSKNEHKSKPVTKKRENKHKQVPPKKEAKRKQAMSKKESELEPVILKKVRKSKPDSGNKKSGNSHPKKEQISTKKCQNSSQKKMLPYRRERENRRVKLVDSHVVLLLILSEQMQKICKKPNSSECLDCLNRASFVSECCQLSMFNRPELNNFLEQLEQISDSKRMPKPEIFHSTSSRTLKIFDNLLNLSCSHKSFKKSVKKLASIFSANQMNSGQSAKSNIEFHEKRIFNSNFGIDQKFGFQSKRQKRQKIENKTQEKCITSFSGTSTRVSNFTMSLVKWYMAKRFTEYTKVTNFKFSQDTIDSFAERLFASAKKKSRLLLIDCRSHQKFARGHLIGSLNISDPEVLKKLFFCHDWAFQQDFLDQLRTYTDSPIDMTVAKSIIKKCKAREESTKSQEIKGQSKEAEKKKM